METSELGHFTPQQRCDPFIIDDLLDFSNHDSALPFDHLHHNNSSLNTTTTITHNNDFNNNYHHHSNCNSDSSTTVVTPVDSCNSSFSDTAPPPPAADIASHISSDLCIPYDDLVELEWLSHFVDDSFSSDDLGFQFMSAMKTRHNEGSETRYYQSEPITNEPAPTSPLFSPEMSVPGKARSKRSRAAPCNWASRLLVVAPEGHEQIPATKPTKPAGSKKKNVALGGVKPTVDSPSGSEVRKCLHCATDKTPQWRTGPMGPKTLCNACGVRYKSGRLVPEYRPASSPTFLLTKHSNSHRKVMELRRQKELMRHQHMQPHPHQQYQEQFIHHNSHNTNSMMFDPCHGDDYLIHQHIGPDFAQLI